MKKIFLTLCLVVVAIVGMNAKPIEVMVLMKARYDRTELCRRAELYRTKAERRDYVVKELKVLHLKKISVHSRSGDYDRDYRYFPLYHRPEPHAGECASGVGTRQRRPRCAGCCY